MATFVPNILGLDFSTSWHRDTGTIEELEAKDKATLTYARSSYEVCHLLARLRQWGFEQGPSSMASVLYRLCHTFFDFSVLLELNSRWSDDEVARLNRAHICQLQE